MNEKLKEMKKMLILQDIKKSSEKSGKFGEGIAKEWLKETWEIIDVSSQDKLFFSQDKLKKNDAKRPDFISIFDDDDKNEKIILWDAKFHTIENNTFKLKDDELEKYRNLKKLFCKEIGCDVNNIHIIFIIFPKSNDGKKMYLVDLVQFCKDGKSSFVGNDIATEIILNDINSYDTSLIQKDELEKLLSRNK